MSSTEKIYDAYWEVEKHLTKEWTSAFFEASLGPLANRRRVLDYGCGMGYSYQRMLRSQVREYVGADVSNVAVQDVREKGCAAEKIADDGSVNLPDGSFDGAVISEVFEHLWDPLSAARELYRVLEPGGTIIATVPNFGYLPWRMLALLRAQVPLEPPSLENRYRGVHIRFFSKLMFTRLLRDAGFREVKVYGWCGSSIWHVFWAAGPLWHIGEWASQNLPAPFQLSFLGRLWPNVFAERLRAVAIK